LETANRYEAGKYVASGHRLLAAIAVAEGDLGTSEAELELALELLRKKPVPVLEWKTYSALGRLKLQMDDRTASREAFARAGEIVDKIASNVDDERLKAIFLNSAAVQEIKSGV
jgi:hypothetical protein